MRGARIGGRKVAKAPGPVVLESVVDRSPEEERSPNVDGAGASEGREDSEDGPAFGQDTPTHPPAAVNDSGLPGAAVDEETRAELLGLGIEVRTAAVIPKGYRPLDASAHELFRVGLEQFEGPLDLLLYLIRKHEIDIFDIPIHFITERYLEMLNSMRALHVEVAAEFIVLAAELTHIKSKMLLPAPEGVPVEEEEVLAEASDPRADLVRRLLEYQKYREAATNLGARGQLGRDTFPVGARPADTCEDFDPGMRPVSIFKLVEMMARMLEEEPVRHEVALETYSVTERIRYVEAFGEARGGHFSLVQLFETIRVRAELVVTFIGILEMIRMGVLKIGDERMPEEAAKPGQVEKIPEIWVDLTGKKAADVVDDYR